MTGLFTVTRKLLLLWSGSTVLAIALVGGIFAYSMNTYYAEIADQKIRDGFSEVRSHLIGQEERLGNILRELTRRDDVQSAMGLVSRYQDINNYQALVFDAEKRKLAAQLGEQTGVSSHHYFAIYDAEGRLTAYHFEKADMAGGLERNGIVTYEDGAPVYMESGSSVKGEMRVKNLPLVLSASLPRERPKYVQTLLSAMDTGLRMAVYAPIVRERKSGAADYLGTFVVVDVIDQGAFDKISKGIGGDLSFAFIDGQNQAAPPEWNLDAPNLLRGDGDYRAVENAEGFSGQATLALDTGGAFVIAMHTDKGQLTTGLAAFENSVAWGLIIFIAVMAPVGLYFINRLISRPIQALMAGVSALSKGRHVGAISIKGNDEFGALARSFSDMSATISAREQDLIRHRESLEQTVQERTEKLKATEAKTRQIVNSAVDGIITTDEKGVILSYNTAAEKIFGYSVIEVVGKNVSMLMPTNHAVHHDAHMGRYVDGGAAKVIGMGRELVAKHKDGSSFLADFSISDFRHGDSVTFVGIIRDITERKQAEYKLQATLEALQNTQDELVQAEKMASLGGLVAGVAHEINTPIGVGLTAATHLKEQADELGQKFADGQLKKSDFQAFIETATQSTGMIYANLNRASDLIKSFKQVAVDQTSEEARQINLLGYIDEVLESLKPNLKRTSHVITVEGDRDILLETHPGALSQVITNLVMNSVIHAYDDDDEGRIQIRAEKNGASVSLTYADDGRGMDDDVCGKIFEPFFTTKRGSGGSGLGMHILYNQVTQTLGGSIDLHSKPGRGTAFDITIPLNTHDLQAGEAS